MKRFSFLFVCGIGLAGCGEETTGDGDADIDADADTDTDADADGDADGGLLRIDYLDLTAPGALDNALVENLINDNIADFTLNWLIELGPPTGETCAYRSGAALTVPAGCTQDCTDFAFETKYPPGAGNADCTANGFRVPEGTGVIAAVDIPVHGDVFIVLPLSEASLTGVYGASPAATGDIAAKITVADATGVQIEDLGMTLCGLLGGDNGELGNYADDCLNILACLDGTVPPDTDWNCTDAGHDGNPPDTDVGGEPAWSVAGSFESNYVTLSE